MLLFAVPSMNVKQVATTWQFFLELEMAQEKAVQYAA
jgi:hypothetical protein